MKRQIALAYAVAGLATAIAVVAVVGSTVGWADAPEPVGLVEAASATPPLTAAGPAVVYVDERGEPLGSRRRLDRDDDRWEHEDRWEHDDDDDSSERREHRGGRHDD